MDSSFEREQLIFDAAVEIEEPSRRAAYLDDACGGDRAFRERIERLLAAHQSADEFFVDCVGGLKPTLEEAEGEVAASGRLSGESVNRRVGPYKLLQNIGEGGCGVVYMAEQEKPVRRRVALKIIKEGMDTRQVIARFEAERQALAMMDHPNIARVLDAGATESGRPFFVMELVRGVRITTFCDERKLDTLDRLNLFTSVCRAIQHAHQKGIIHRDIKPSNVLVTLHDGVPVPKVIDFGIAKAMETPLTDKTLFTVYGHFVGTPAYMSPEQAEMSGLDVDTRSDIYSLGVLLYELLTGRTPFDQDELVKSGFDEMRRTLREKEPHRPSTKLDTIPEVELTATALQRHAEPPKLKSLLSGDLDWIVMKALEKDRSRRYETANALAMDIERYLGNEPILARPPSRLYRFQKLVRRNRSVFAATAAVALALILGTTISTWMFVRERDARRRALEAEQQQLRMREAAETREKLTQAATLISRERFAEADALMKGVQLSAATLEGAAVFRSLAEWHALRRSWREAADRYGTLLRVDQLDGWNIASMDHLGAGAAFAALNNPGVYDDFRTAVMARFAGTHNPVVAERVLKISLLRPTPLSTLQRLAGFANLAAPKSPVGLIPQSPVATFWQKNPSGSISVDSGLGGIGNLSPDTTPPALLGAYSYDGVTLGLEFSEAMQLPTLANPRQYSIAGIVVTNAVADADERTVVLQLDTSLPDEFVVSVTGLKDRAGNRIAPGTAIGGRVVRLHLQNVNTEQSLSLQSHGHAFTMEAGGADMYETDDRFGFAYQLLRGDFDFRVRVHSVAPALDPFTRTGLEARDSLDEPASRHVLVAVNAQNSFQVVLRTVAGATSASIPPNPLPTAFGSNSWVRLQRSGSVFHAYASRDGMDWVQLHQFDSAVGAEGPFADPLYVGIATCAHSSKATTTAVLSRFGRTPTVPVNATVAFALLEYRRGDHAKAVEWGRRCLAHPEYNAARIATARAVLAMSLHRLGDLEGSRSQLEQSHEMIQRKFKSGLDLGGGAHGFWFDWVFAQTLLQEADELIRGAGVLAD